MLRALAAGMALLLAGCAAYEGRGLRPGESRAEEVLAVMGTPAMSWQDADGSRQLAYPRGPAGFHTYMVRLAADGRMISVENVLDLPHLAAVKPGLDKAAVLRLLGPPDAAMTAYYRERDELAWDWRFIEGFSEPMRMIVLFDATAGTVRGSFYLLELPSFANPITP